MSGRPGGVPFIDLPGVEVVKKGYRVEDEIAKVQSLDIGTMPLQSILWTRRKCGFTILQCTGVGVPAATKSSSSARPCWSR